MSQTTQPDHRIVVGVDGSPCSEGALRWAITQAQETGAGVEAIAAWQNPVNAGYSLGFMPALDSDVDWATLTEKVLRESVARAVKELQPGVQIVTRVVQGHPAQVLLDAAASAQLLVLGSRGHGTLAGMLLGSVSQHCVQHAPCPVVVVRGDHPAQTAETVQA